MASNLEKSLETTAVNKHCCDLVHQPPHKDDKVTYYPLAQSSGNFQILKLSAPSANAKCYVFV